MALLYYSVFVGAVIVTTSQQVAMQDAIKGVEMFKKTNIPVLGYVSNMSAFVCPSCGTKTPISSKAKSFFAQTGVEKLGEIPFNIEIGDCSDEGNPLVVSQPDSSNVSLFADYNYVSLLLSLTF